MSVVALKSYRNRDTVSVLKCLLNMALDGEVTGLAMSFTDDQGVEHSAFTGLYKATPAEGVKAALRLSWELTEAQQLLTGNG